MRADPLTVLARAFSIGRRTPSGELASHMERIHRDNLRLNAIVTLNPAAESEAAGSDERCTRGEPRSDLDGVTFLAKDNLYTAGLRTTWGSLLYESFTPDHDELVIARLRAAGAVLVGKTNTPEFAAFGHTRNRLFGATRNPWDQALTAGGSSGGTASGLAAGFAAFGLGTDAGGSVRRPASYCGLVGFKPTPGRIPRAGGFPSSEGGVDVVGPLTRSLDDLEAVLRVLAEPHGPGSEFRSWSTWSPLSERSLRLRVVTRINDLPVEPGLVARVLGLGRSLAARGHAVEQRPLEIDGAEMSALGGLLGWEVKAHLMSTFDDIASRVEDYSAGRFMSSEPRPDADARTERHGAFRSWAAHLFDDSDLIISPTVAAQPWPVEDDYPAQIDGRPAGPRDHAAFTGWVNIAGLPAISVPLTVDDAGLPVGVQLIGKPGDDEFVVAAARTLVGDSLLLTPDV